MSSELFPVYMLVLFIAATVFFLFIRRGFRKRRQNLIQRQALKLGLRPALNPDAILDTIWQQRFLLLSTERPIVGRGVENLLEGYVGRHRVLLFDFEMNIPHETNACQSVVVIAADKVQFPKFALVPRKLRKERFTQRLRTATREFVTNNINRYRKINTPIDGYTLSCPMGSEQQVRNLLSSEMIAYFSKGRKYALEGSDNQLLLYERERLVTPGSLEKFIADTLSIQKLIAEAIN